MRDQTCVVVANLARARFYSMRGRVGELTELHNLVHPEARLHERDLTSDRAGRTFESANDSRSAMEPQHTAKEHEAERFAAELAAEVERHCAEQGYRRLILVAPPRLLGYLRPRLGTRSREILAREIQKDYSAIANPVLLRKALPDWL
jgi:protein required for attachment to host cells